MTPAYDDSLHAYLSKQRWFAGKGRDFAITERQPVAWLSGDADGSTESPWVRLELVTVTYADGATDTYQFPTAYFVQMQQDLGHAYVGDDKPAELGDVAAYDAVHVKPASHLLLEGFRTVRSDPALRFGVVEGAELPDQDAVGAVMTSEQSNTSIAYGDDALLKLFRRVEAGRNPDIDIHYALTRHAGDFVAPLLGWLEGTWRGPDGMEHTGHLGMLQVFLTTASDGWHLALASVRNLLLEESRHADEVGGDFAGESERLGLTTAGAHAALAEVFDTSTLDRGTLADLSAAMRARLDAAVAIVPELGELAPALGSTYAALAEHTSTAPTQRVHGDLHLGQTLRTVKGWKIIDFEGEPAKPLSERTALDSPLRDVAGMLRSFDYAANATLEQFPEEEHVAAQAQEWAARNRDAFLQGYGKAATTELDPVLLSAYEADKAVYEAVYESRNRPTWLSIPLRALRRLAGEEES